MKLRHGCNVKFLGNRLLRSFLSNVFYCILFCVISLSCSVDPLAFIVYPQNPSKLEELAAKEVRRYVYQTTGELLPLVSSDVLPEKNKNYFVIASANTKLLSTSIFDENLKKETEGLGKENFLLKTIQRKKGKICLICGGGDVGTLYGAYDLARHFGVRFYLHGDVIPDVKKSFVMPDLDENEKPLFKLRGILPFHDFPEGPDWWTRNDYKSFLSQLPKLKMNFVGFHTYPEGGLGPEPTVWVGLPQDCNADGTVNFSDATSWHNTQRDPDYDGLYRPEKTGNFSYGGSDVFETDDYGPEVNTPSDFPFPETMEQSNAMINRTGTMLNDVLGYAQKLGIKTCVGTEAPLNIPQVVDERLKELGKDPVDSSTVKELYEGMFKRIMLTYPIDYYWFWGHEGQIKEDAFQKDVLQAVAAKEKLSAPFKLGICGWGWIANNFPSLDKVLPGDMAFSCISGSLGRDFINPNYNKIQRDEKWAISWFEDDPAMISPQLYVGRLLKDASDALQYKCTGLMGLHWRTRILGPNIDAMAQSAWNQVNANSKKNSRVLPVDDFYKDWAVSQFGKEVAKKVSSVFIKLDGKFPRTSRWYRGPGVIVIPKTTWEEEKIKYAFVAEMENLRTQVIGAGNLERFDYWLNQFRYVKAMAQVGCCRRQLDLAMAQINEEEEYSSKLKIAEGKALPLRIKLNKLLGEMYGYLLATLNNSSEMGTIANVEQQSMLRCQLLTFHDDALRKILQKELPAEANPWKEYRGPVRIIVPAKRTLIDSDELLKLKVICLGNEKVKELALYYKGIGKAAFHKVPLTHVARSVYSVSIPPFKNDLEYYIQAKTEEGDLISWPATAPELNHTVLALNNLYIK